MFLQCVKIFKSKTKQKCGRHSGELESLGDKELKDLGFKLWLGHVLV